MHIICSFHIAALNEQRNNHIISRNLFAAAGLAMVVITKLIYKNSCGDYSCSVQAFQKGRIFGCCGVLAAFSQK